MNDQEIEQELIRLFGMDGTGDTSEDDQEESDFDENHEEQVLFQGTLLIVSLYLATVYYIFI